VQNNSNPTSVNNMNPELTQPSEPATNINVKKSALTGGSKILIVIGFLGVMALAVWLIADSFNIRPGSPSPTPSPTEPTQTIGQTLSPTSTTNTIAPTEEGYLSITAKYEGEGSTVSQDYSGKYLFSSCNVNTSQCNDYLINKNMIQVNSEDIGKTFSFNAKINSLGVALGTAYFDVLEINNFQAVTSD